MVLSCVQQLLLLVSPSSSCSAIVCCLVKVFPWRNWNPCKFSCCRCCVGKQTFATRTNIKKNPSWATGESVDPNEGRSSRNSETAEAHQQQLWFQVFVTTTIPIPSLLLKRFDQKKKNEKEINWKISKKKAKVYWFWTLSHTHLPIHPYLENAKYVYFYLYRL